jgi:hypothetical protein
MSTSTDDIPLVVSWFPTAMPAGPAFGDPELMTWGTFCGVFHWRREGEKDGPNFVPARFKLEDDRRYIRRLKANVVARTAIALDIERNKETGELPLAIDDVVGRVKALDLAAVCYTSHSHNPPHSIRYRLVMPLSAEIAPEPSAPEIMAEQLGLAGVLDRSKTGATSVFYLPSCPHGMLEVHQEIIITGGAIDAAWISERASAMLIVRQAGADRIAAEAQTEAAVRRAYKLMAGFDPHDSLIEKLRSRFALDSVLIAHGYHKSGTKYRHPNSTSGSYGADIKVLGGIERLFSHNGTDPLHGNNLPVWCGGVTALDAFDVVTILEFGGDRQRALRGLADRFGITKAEERKMLARLIFRMIRCQSPQEAIEASAYAEGLRLGLSRDEVCHVARWVARQAVSEHAA